MVMGAAVPGVMGDNGGYPWRPKPQKRTFLVSKAVKMMVLGAKGGDE